MTREVSNHISWARKIILAIGVLVGTLILNNVQAQELENSLLWEISGNGIKTSYVYGTFHLLPQSDFELKGKVTDAFDKSELIVMEMDMDNPNMQLELMQNIAMKDGKTIDQYLSDDDYKKMNEYLKGKVGMGLDQMKQFKPFFIASMLIPSMIEGTPASYEMAFVQRALNQEKEILGLETPKEQTEIFDNIPYEVQAEELMRVLNEEDEMADLFGQMISNYKEENINRMYDLMLENMSDDTQEEFLLVNRNKKWIPKMTVFSKDKSTFFAVGAGHLGGENGVIQLLNEAGYTVRPVME